MARKYYVYDHWEHDWCNTWCYDNFGDFMDFIENATPKKYCFYEILKLNAETILFLMFCIFLYIVFFIIF